MSEGQLKQKAILATTRHVTLDHKISNQQPALARLALNLAKRALDSLES